MWKCTQCHTQNSDSVNICKQCGHCNIKFTVPVQPAKKWYCPSCKELNDPTQTSCWACGVRKDYVSPESPPKAKVLGKTDVLASSPAEENLAVSSVANQQTKDKLNLLSPNHPVLIFVGLLIAISVLGFYFSPYLSVYNMKKAVEKQDVDALSHYVDYPALRESLKANFNAMMASEIAQSDNPFGALGTALGAVIVNQMIDAFITPESLAMMIKGEEPQIGNSEKQHTETPSLKTEAETSMSYEGVNQFVVKVKDKNSSEDPIRFIYKRAGFVSWKLSALRLPSFKGGKTVPTASSKSTTLDPAFKKAKSEKVEKPLLVPTLLNKRFQESNWESRVYEEAVWFDISWDTTSLLKPTRAIKGTLIISDLFGESKLRLNWTINEPLTPGMSYAEKGVGFEYNQFTDSHKWVRATELKDMIFQFEATDIIYQDGTQETF